MQVKKLKYIFNLLVATIILLTVAVSRDERILGHTTESLFDREESAQVATEELRSDGRRVVNTITLAEDVVGYAGAVPIFMSLEGDRIVGVELGENFETYSYLHSVEQSGLLDSWNGLTVDEALELRVDGVSGATYTSGAILEGVSRALHYISDSDAARGGKEPIPWRVLAGLAVIASGVGLSFWGAKSKLWRTIQLILNVVVLGFWCKSFLSLSLLVGWLSSGVNLSVAIQPLLLLVVAIVGPLLGKRSNYCANHCPLGSLQELISKASKPLPNVIFPPRVLNILNMVGEVILALLIMSVWLGVGYSLMDYELFSIFTIAQMSIFVSVIALLTLLLSPFIMRPYCRFICPTGALMRITQITK